MFKHVVGRTMTKQVKLGRFASSAAVKSKTGWSDCKSWPEKLHANTPVGRSACWQNLQRP